jgi:hypothetical protein
MRVLIVSDGHGALGNLDRIEAIVRESDLVLYGGDFAAVGAPESGRPFLERFASFHDRIFAVTGNCDEPDFRDDLEEYDMGIEGSLSFFNGLVLSGSGGGSKFTGTTPNERSDEDLAGDLRLVAESAGPDGSVGDGLWDNLVIIAHNPPKDTKLDMISNGAHVGSPLIRAFIEKYRPLLVVSGHIHESAAIDRLGETTLVNPGALAEGKYALAEIVGGGKVPFSVASIELKSLD